MRWFSALLRPLFLLALAGGIACVVAGCDGGSSKRTSQFRNLEGAWRIQRIDLRGAELVLQDTVQVEFFSDEGGRSYRLVRPSQQNSVTAEGAIDILNANALSMTKGFAQPLVWTFDFEKPSSLTTSVRFSLQSRWEGSVEAFLNAIGQGGTARSIEMDLVREGE